MVYTLTLNPALDYVMQLEELRFDDINRATKETIYYGGKGINVSTVLHRLGVDTQMLGFVGGFSGRKLEEMLAADDMDFDFNAIQGGNTRINVKVKYNAELDINANGPKITEEDIEALLQKLEKLQDGDYLVLAGSIPSGLPDDTYQRILEHLSGKDIKFIVDTTDQLLLNVLPYHPFLIKPNHLELGDLFGVTADTEEVIVECAKKLQEKGARNVLVSRAADGAVLVDETGAVSVIGGVKGTLVNSVGSGDSMVAGFLAGYIQTGDYAYALKLGVASGSATAFSPELATKAEIESILANGFDQ